ncbi:retrovirus-related pol polyprotein from transposon TNT 1-94 [Tanacetum coccineum]|uniref:Retrovirus-related pol polyprotein from transposon TNT 1-94 n=1 Tax=Tanacetum coccineum TaxID=301880 RepID=A0ABQ5FA72_9ASTR
MTTLAEHIIVAGAENRPPMLEESMYDSWASRIRLFIKGKKHGRMMLDSIDNGPLQVQVNTKFLNALQPEWSKFVTDVKLAKSLYTTNYDQLGIVTTSGGNYAAGQAKIVKCYNCLEEGHMAKQCPHLKRPRSFAWYREKLMLVEAQEAGQTEDLDAYDSDCDDTSSAKVVLMANLSSCDPDVLSEVPYSDSYPNDMINQDVQEMSYSEQTYIDDYPYNEINSDSNIIPYFQYLQESQDAGIQDTNSSTPNYLLVLSLVEQMTDHIANLDKENQTNKMVNESLTAELERYKERVTIFEQRLNLDLNKREKLIDSQMDDLIRNRNAKFVAFQLEIDTLKETLSNHAKEKEYLSKTLIVFKTEFKEKESKYIDKEIVLEKQNKELENIIYDEETLILEEESRSKMIDIQNDPISIEKKINISLIDYSKLNKIKEGFGKRFVTQKELSAEQAFWLKHSNYNPDTPVKSHTLVRIEAPSEVPKVSLVNESLKKLKYQLASFDKVVKKITTSDAITAAVNSVDILDVKKSCVNECNKCPELKTKLLKKKDLIEKMFTINF